MKRLTKRKPLPKVPCFVEQMEEDYTTKNKRLAINKLGALEDIEEWLGVDLITLFKALKDGIHTTEGLGFVRYVELSLLSDIWYLTNEEEGLALPVETYGQFWALTKEKLE